MHKKRLLFALLALLSFFGDAFAQGVRPTQGSQRGYFSYADRQATPNKKRTYGIDIPSGFVATAKLPTLSASHTLRGIIFDVAVMSDKRAALLVLDSKGTVIHTEPFEAKEGRNEIFLATPLQLQSGDYYVGYYVHSRASELSPIVCDGDKQPLMGVNFLAVVDRQPKTFKVGDIVDQKEFTDPLYGNLLLAIDIEGPDVQRLAVVESLLGLAPTEPGSTALLDIVVRNVGTHPITEVEAHASHRGQQKSYKLPCDLPAGQAIAIPIAYQFPSEGDDEPIVLSITAINGKPNPLREQKFLAPFKLKRSGGQTPLTQVLLERFTTEPCGNCPRGAERTTLLAERLRDQGIEVEIIAHHAGYKRDPYTLPESEKLMPYIFSGERFYAPALSVNRLPIGLDGCAAMVINDLTVKTIPQTLKAELQDGAITSLRFTEQEASVAGYIASGVSTSDIHINLILTEDKIYSDNQAGYNGTYEHNNVARRFITPSLGEPLRIEEDRSFAVTFPIEDFPAEWKRENLRLVAFATYRESDSASPSFGRGKVLFVKAAQLGNPQASISPAEGDVEILLYGNRIAVRGDFSSLALYDLQGRSIDTSTPLTAGVYILQVATPRETIIRKIFIPAE